MAVHRSSKFSVAQTLCFLSCGKYNFCSQEDFLLPLHCWRLAASFFLLRHCIVETLSTSCYRTSGKLAVNSWFVLGFGGSTSIAACGSSTTYADDSYDISHLSAARIVDGRIHVSFHCWQSLYIATVVVHLTGSTCIYFHCCWLLVTSGVALAIVVDRKPLVWLACNHQWSSSSGGHLYGG
jgi:hypothetical protein